MPKTKKVVKVIGALTALGIIVDSYIIYQEMRKNYPTLDSRTRRRAWHSMVKAALKNEHPELMKGNPYITQAVFELHVARVTQ